MEEKPGSAVVATEVFVVSAVGYMPSPWWHTVCSSPGRNNQLGEIARSHRKPHEEPP